MHHGRNLLIGGLSILLLTMATDNGHAKKIPDFIALDSLVRLYEKVNFSHAKHIGLTNNCAQCHHHTTGTAVDNPNCVRCHKNSGATKNVACRGCHSSQPFSSETIRENRSNRSIYHKDKPGLKGAYHLTCRGCHAQYGLLTGCQDCHPRKKEGDAFYNANVHSSNIPKN